MSRRRVPPRAAQERTLEQELVYLCPEHGSHCECPRPRLPFLPARTVADAWRHLERVRDRWIELALGVGETASALREELERAEAELDARRAEDDDRKSIKLLDVHGCARCGGEHDLAFYPFTSGDVQLGATTIKLTHWATCPATGEPVLMVLEDSTAWLPGR